MMSVTTSFSAVACPSALPAEKNDKKQTARPAALFRTSMVDSPLRKILGRDFSLHLSTRLDSCIFYKSSRKTNDIRRAAKVFCELQIGGAGIQRIGDRRQTMKRVLVVH